MSDEVKIWRCKNGHTMGQVARNGSGVRRLLLYREAVDPEQAVEAVDVIAVVEGYVADVRCSLCGAMRTWVPGEEAIREMLERMEIK